MVGRRSSLVMLVFLVTVILVPSTSGMMWSSFWGVFSLRSPMTRIAGSFFGGALAAKAGAAKAIAVKARMEVFGTIIRPAVTDIVRDRQFSPCERPPATGK